MGLAVVIHIATAVFIAMGLGMLLGQLSVSVACISLISGFLAGGWIWWKLREDASLFPKITFGQSLFYGFIIYAGLRHFLYLLYFDQNTLRTLHANNFGDLTMHIQYIRSIAQQQFWPVNPGFAGEFLKYPFGIDLYNALWEIIGVPLDSHLFFVGGVLTVAAVSFLHRWMGWLGVGAFFLNGGLANWQFFPDMKLHDFQNALAWKNFLVSLWITQRGFLFAVPAGICVIQMITEALLGERNLSRTEKTVCAFLWSSLAFFHLHTFFIISIALGLSIMAYKKVRPMWSIVIPVFITGFAFVWFSTDGFVKANILHIQWGWVAGQESLLKFWLVNLGPWIVPAAVAVFFLMKASFADLRPMAMIFAGLFFAFTFVIVAPWDWDNIKVLLWVYLLLAWIVWRTWVNRLPSAAAFFAGCILFFSGTVSVVSSLPANTGGVELYRISDVWESKAALSGLQNDAVLAVAPDPNHPAMFWGRQVAMGYPGHLWTHGIDYTGREGELDALFKGRGDWHAIAERIGVTHIYWGDNEKRKYGTFHPSWQNEIKNVSRSQKIQVYDLRAGGKQP